MVVIFEKKELISKISTKTETANFYYAQAPLAKILLQRSLRSRKLLLFSSLRSHENTTICARFAGAQKTTMSEASLFTPGFGTVGKKLGNKVGVLKKMGVHKNIWCKKMGVKR